MIVKSLKLTNFRNYRALELDFDHKGAIVTGYNGTGKTNLLEALYYLAFGKSFRFSSDLEMINFDSSFFRIMGTFNTDIDDINISAAADKKSKIFKVNGIKLEKVSELFNYLKVVYCSSSDLEIALGSPVSRRLFLDQAISQSESSYLTDLINFRHILKQRNALLKSEFDKAEKTSWDLQYISAAEKIVKHRLLYLYKFKPILFQQYNNFIQHQDTVDLNYIFSFPFNPSDDFKSKFAEHLKRSEFQEKIAQRTLFGPHLDDLQLLLNGKNARNYASQGQARSLVIIIRLVQTILICKNSGNLPLLMFDDVLSELDEIRAKAVLDLIEDRFQILIATPFISHYKDIPLSIIDLKNLI